MNQFKILIAVSIISQLLIGCAGQEAFSKLARSGDTVSLALGGSPSHEINGDVLKSDMVVTITDSSSMTYPVKLRYLFKLHGDPTSKLNYTTMHDYDVSDFATRAYKQPNLGEWIAVVDLVDPVTDVPPPLSLGSAQIHVSTPDLVNSVPFAIANSDGDTSSIGIEIVAGVGTSHELNTYGNPGILEPLPQIVVGADNSQIVADYVDVASATIVNAISFDIDYDDTVFQGQFPPMIRGNINDPRIVVNSAVVNQGGNKVIKVIVLTMDPGKGIVANPDPDLDQDTSVGGRRRSKIGDLKVHVVWDPNKLASPITAANYATVFPVSGYSVFDIDGNEMLGTGGGPLVTPLVEFRDGS